MVSAKTYIRPDLLQAPVPIEEQEYYEISLKQQDSLFSCSLNGHQRADNMEYHCELIDLDTDAFKKAFLQLIRKYEILRTTFIKVGDEIKQKVRSFEEINIAVEELDLSGNIEKHEFVKEQANRELSYLFDLSSGPLIKASLYHLGDGKYCFVLTIHHIICDALSFNILVQDHREMYAQFVEDAHYTGCSPGLQFKDYSAWQNGIYKKGKYADDIQYWSAKGLRSADGLVSFDSFYQNFYRQSGRSCPPVSPARYRSHDELAEVLQKKNGKAFSVLIGQDIKEKLVQLGIRNSTSLFCVLLATFNSLLFTVCGQQTSILCFPIANRFLTRTIKLVGNIMGTLYLDIAMRKDMTMDDVVNKVNDDVLKSSAHIINGHSGFTDFYFLTNTAMYVNFMDESVITNLAIGKASAHHVAASPHFALECIMNSCQDGLILNWRYNADLFTPEMLDYLVGEHLAILKNIS